MSDTIGSSLTHSLTLASPAYTSPTLLTGSVHASAANAAIYLPSPWSLDIVGVVIGNELAVFADAEATLTNSGYLRGRNAIGVDLFGGGELYNAGGTIVGGTQGVYSAGSAVTTLTNAGTIIGGTDGLETGPGLVLNQEQGTIAGDEIGVWLTGAASLANHGLIEALLAGGAGVSLAASATLLNAGGIEGYTGLIAAGGTVINQGFIAGASLSLGVLQPSAAATAVRFTSPGTFVEDAGLVAGSVTGDGGLLLLESGSLTEISGFARDSFASGASAALSGSLAGFGTIAGFAGGDTLHLTDVTANSAFFLGHVLTLQNAGTVAGLITFTASYPQFFQVKPDPSGGTDVTVPCFCAGTRIATSQGEIPVEALSIGDLVRTRDAGLQPIRWIGRRSYAARLAARNAELQPIEFAPGAIAPGIPKRVLRVSPGHAICIGEALVPAGYLVNGTTITRCEVTEALRYFHLELAQHEVIYAEGCPAETFLDATLRWQFQNAAEFAARYPEAQPSRPCLPRLEQGFALDAIQRRLGRNPALGGGPVQGLVERIDSCRVAGWAQFAHAPAAPVCLDIFGQGQRLARALANQCRADLRRAGIGDGHHGFDVQVPQWVAPVEVRCTVTGEALALAKAAQKPCARAA